MNLKRYTASCICLGLVLAVWDLNAELVKGNDPRFGAEALTIDTSTGLGWLNLSLSTGLSYDLAQSATQPGGPYSGFRLATAQEVLTLYSSAGIPGVGWYPDSSSFSQSVQNLLLLLGPTSSQDGKPEMFAICDTGVSAGSHLVPGLDFAEISFTSGYMVTATAPGTLNYGDATGDPAVGAWLVKPIPEPSPIALSILGLILFRFPRLRSSRVSPHPNCT